jgi:hypothetical protein
MNQVLVDVGPISGLPRRRIFVTVPDYRDSPSSLQGRLRDRAEPMSCGYPLAPLFETAEINRHSS